MSVKWTTRSGKQVTLLNPAEKGAKAATELKLGVHITNDGIVKCDKFGNAIPLTSEQRAWRSGMLAARKDSANCWKAKNGKKDKKTKAGKNYPATF